MALKNILKVSFVLAFTVSAVLNAETSDVSIQYETGGYYEGEFNDGKRHGIGSYELPNGYKYTGNWVNGEIFGHGEAQYPNGSSYQGTFVNGKPDGFGKILLFKWWNL